MRKKVDVIIRYEHKVRELENIMLIKIEMERRGYSVAFVANYDYKDKQRYSPKLIVSPAIYQNSQLNRDVSQYGIKNKIANLLWEQVNLRINEEAAKNPQNVYGIGQKAITFCWGKNTQRRLQSVGMPKKNAKVVGLLNTDFLRAPFTKLLATKKQLSEKYDININARWNLFISSFAYCEMNVFQEMGIRKDFGDKFFEDYTKISVESRKILLSWFEEALIQYPNDVIIYRPHPDEIAKSDELHKLVEKYPNFYIIGELSLKHWFNAVDKIYNWHSTGIIDAILLNKPCRMLRPYEIASEYDYKFFEGASLIKSLDVFLDDYKSLDATPCLDMNMVDDYYFLPKRYVYLEICDILEEMLCSSKYDIQFTKDEKKYLRKVYFRAEIMRKISFIKPILRRLNLYKNKFAMLDAYEKAIDEGYSKNVATKEEIALIYNRLKPIIYGEKI